jgi:hypothetical protein
MAVWQYSMHLVPRAELARFVPGLSGVLPEPLFDDIAWWATLQPPVDLVARLTAVLPEIKGWNSSCRLWGAEDSHTVSVSYSGGDPGGGVVDEIWARLDLRQPRLDVVGVLVGIAQACDGWWIGGEADGRVLVGSTDEDVLLAIRRSAAARFVADPHAFLRNLDRHT